MVQIATAWAVHRETGEASEIAASAMPKLNAAEYDFLCPDQCCRVPLSHYKQHEQTFKMPDSDEYFRTTVAAHYQRKKGAPAHADACTAVDDYTKYQIYARKHGGVSCEGGAFMFHLNIPTRNEIAPLRKKPSRLTQEYQRRAMNKVIEASKAVLSQETSQPKKGINGVERLAGLLDKSAFNPEMRHSIMLRDGQNIVTLAQIYQADPIAFYREDHKRAKQSASPSPALVHFKPIAIGKYHSAGGRTIQGMAIPVTASNGKAKYYVSMLLHCGDDKLYEDIKDQIRLGGRSFLIYTPLHYVSLIELAHTKRDLEIDPKRDSTLYVHIHADRPEQIMRWSPPSPQLSLALPIKAQPALENKFA